MDSQILIESLSTSLSLLGAGLSSRKKSVGTVCAPVRPVGVQLARRAGLQDSDAADVTQDVFEVLSRQLDRFDQYRSGAKFRAWLWGIVRNKLKEHARALHSQPNPGLGGDHAEFAIAPLPQDGDPSAIEETNALANRALKLIETDFAPQTWQIFWRVAMAGDRPVDVAADLGISVASVYTAKSRVLKHLRQELDGILD